MKQILKKMKKLKKLGYEFDFLDSDVVYSGSPIGHIPIWMGDSKHDINKRLDEYLLEKYNFGVILKVKWMNEVQKSKKF